MVLTRRGRLRNDDLVLHNFTCICDTFLSLNKLALFYALACWVISFLEFGLFELDHLWIPCVKRIHRVDWVIIGKAIANSATNLCWTSIKMWGYCAPPNRYDLQLMPRLEGNSNIWGNVETTFHKMPQNMNTTQMPAVGLGLLSRKGTMIKQRTLSRNRSGHYIRKKKRHLGSAIGCYVKEKLSGWSREPNDFLRMPRHSHKQYMLHSLTGK